MPTPPAAPGAVAVTRALPVPAAAAWAALTDARRHADAASTASAATASADRWDFFVRMTSPFVGWS